MTQDKLLEQAIELLALADFSNLKLAAERNQVVKDGVELLLQPKPPWSQKTIEQKIEASISHYKKEIERAKEVGDPHQFVGTYEGFVVCLESILEKNNG
jgi:hypothetical protein